MKKIATNKPLRIWLHSIALVAAAGAALAALSPAAMADEEGKFLAALTERMGRSIANVSFYIDREEGAQEMAANGVIVSAEGLVMISSGFIPDHVAVDQLSGFSVAAPGLGEDSWSATLLGKDDQADVAFVQIDDEEAPEFPAIAFDEAASRLSLGDPVITIGPLSKSFNHQPSFETGRVSAVIETPFLQHYLTGTSRNVPGSIVTTGGGTPIGIVDMTGEIMLPAAVFGPLIANPPRPEGEEKKAWLGISGMQSVSQGLGEYFGIDAPGGILVGSVVPGGPAEAAGFKVKDIILSVDGAPIRRELESENVIENFIQTVKLKSIGQTALFDVWRDGTTQKMSVTLGETPKTERHAERFRSKSFGLTVRELVFGDLYFQKLPLDQKGVYVEYTQRAGWASDGGLGVSDIILKLNGEPISTLKDFEGALEAVIEKRPDSVIVQALRGGLETVTLRIEPNWAEFVEEEGK